MQEIQLSNNLQQIELEIRFHKSKIGESIWEIGRRLNHVKENDLAHGEFINWLSKIKMDRYEATRFMKVAKELPNVDMFTHLGNKALYLIATLPEEEKQAQLERIEQGEQAQLMVEQNKALEQMIEEMTNLKNEMNITASKTNTRLSEVEILIEEVNKKVHIDDVEASEIKSIISRQANEFANEYFELEKAVD